MRRSSLFMMLCLFTILASAVFAGVGDTVELTLRSGERVEGKILSETTFKYVVETSISGITFEKTIAKSDIRHISTIESAEEKRLEAVRETNAPAPPDTDATKGGYAVVPARGAIGEELTAGFFTEVLERAERDHAELVIFHLESPGGMVHVLEEIRTVLDKYDRDMEIAFYTDDECFSAAALLAMSAEHMYIGPGARFGAAVGFSWNDSGAAEVDAKFNSALASTWRSYAEAHGRPGLIVDAMILPEVEVYADTSSEPWTLLDDRPSAYDEKNAEGNPRYKQIDSSRSILSLTYEEVPSLGAVDGTADSPREIAKHLDLDNPSRVAFEGDDLWDVYAKRYRTNTKMADKAIDDYFTATELIGLEETRFGVKRKIRRMLSNLRKASQLADRYDYIMIRFARQGIAVEDIDSTIAELNQILAKL